MREVNATFSLPDFIVQSVKEEVIEQGGETLHTRQHEPSPSRVLDVFGINDIFEGWGGVYFGGNLSAGSMETKKPKWAKFHFLPLEAATTDAVPDPVTEGEFFGTDPASRAKVMKALETLWQKSMAQVAGSGLRSQPYEQPRVVRGTLWDRGRQRMVQNEASTRILQGLYGMSLLCLAVGFVCYRGTDASLSFAPTSVGGVAKFLAESGILRRIEEAVGASSESGKLDGQKGPARVPPGTELERLSGWELAESGIFDVSAECLSGLRDVPGSGTEHWEGSQSSGIAADVRRGCEDPRNTAPTWETRESKANIGDHYTGLHPASSPVALGSQAAEKRYTGLVG
jgi:hypothetical protein